MRSHQGGSVPIGDKRPAGAARASIDGNACIVVKRPSPQCKRCHDACPSGAITLTAHEATIALSSCTGCGRCASACPTGAVEVAGFDPLCDATGGTVRIECNRVPAANRGSNAIEVPCLGGLSVNWLLARIAGARLVVVDRGWCHSCPAGGTAAPWRVAVESTDRLLSIVSEGRASRITTEHVPLAIEIALPPPRPAGIAGPEFSRRRLFARMVEQPSPGASPRRPERSELHSPSTVTTGSLEARRKYLSALSHGRPLPAALFPSVSIAPNCGDCQVCARSCPTSALTSATGPSLTGIDFDPALCLACGECERTCPTRSIAIRQAGEGSYGGVIALRRARRVICRECERDFAPQDDECVCPACGKDRDIAAAGFAMMRRQTRKTN